MTIQRVESVIYGVEDMNGCTRFLNDWGLEQLEYSDKGASFSTPVNQIVFLRRNDDTSLPPTEEEGSTARLIIWGVDTKEALEDVASELSKDRDVSWDQEGRLLSYDDSGFPLGFQVSSPIKVKTETTKLNFHDDINRLNQHSWPKEKIQPIRIGHVVFSIRADRNMETANFYLKRLNFRITDRSHDGGTFMRCEGSNFHHNIFLFHRGDNKRFNHIAFEVENFDHLMAAGTKVVSNGWHTESGPGRHSLGSNWFWYFHCPCGGSIEYFADMDRMDDDWEPRYWDEGPPFARWMLGEELLKP